MENQTPAPIVSLPQGASFDLDQNTIASLEQAETIEAPQFENWDVDNIKKFRAIFVGVKFQLFPSQKPDSDEKEEVETAFFKAIIDGKPKNMYCAAKQFVRKIKEMQDMFPAGTNFPFAAEYLGMEKGNKNLKYRNFALSFLKPK